MDINDIACVMLHGPSGSGKSETAKMIAAPQGLLLSQKYNNHIIHSDTIALAGPLVEMHSIKVNTLGFNAQDRRLWMLNQVFNELIPTLSCDFEEFIETIYDAESYELNTSESDNGLVRDRDFMTFMADACHELADNPFSKYAGSKIKKQFRELSLEHKEDMPMKYLVIISDLRLRAELDYFEQTFPNIMKIKLDVSKEVQTERLIKRDGLSLTDYQMSHKTQISPFENEEFDLVVNSENLALEDQVSMIKQHIYNEITNGALV